MRKSWMLILLIGVFGINATEAQIKDGWTITTESIDPDNYFGVTVANGMIGLVSSAEPLQVEETVLNGVYDYYGRGRVSNILKGFNFADMFLAIDGTRLSRSNIADYRQKLDMKGASLETTFSHAGKVDVSYTVRALRHLPFTSLIEVTVQAKKEVTIMGTSVIEAPDILREVRQYYSEIDRPHVTIPLMTSVGESPTGKHTLAVSNSFLFPEEHGHQPKVTHEDWHHNQHWMNFTRKLNKGESYTFYVVASEVSTEHVQDPVNEAERLTIYAALEGADRLLSRHNAAWDELWKSDIIIEGNVEDQTDVRFALYHLYSFGREGTRLSLSPMGLSGLGYNGHVFWDTELWMYPPVLMLQPQIARSFIDYRTDRLEQAKMNAFSHGYKGAMFPWESDDSGQESTPVWALTGPFEHHISGTVAFAFWNYFQVTQDKEWLRNEGFPAMKEIADFWVSRVELGSDGKYHINNVVGADEWAENIDDNAFTNGAAISALRAAIDAANVLGIKGNSEWKTVADNIVILNFEDGVTREHASYEGEAIKQADVNLLAYPLKLVTEDKSIEKDLKYYEPRIGDGPAMSHSILSILYNKLNDPENAYRLFKRGYVPNQAPPFGVLAENAGGTNPYFATGAGGMLQAVLSGFGGLELTNEGIIQKNARLPSNWDRLIITGVGPDMTSFYCE